MNLLFLQNARFIHRRQIREKSINFVHTPYLAALSGECLKTTLAPAHKDKTPWKGSSLGRTTTRGWENTLSKAQRV